MATLLSRHANSRDNNFNLIRFIAASLVLYSHSFALTIGTPEAEPLRTMLGMTWAGMAVDLFFITSGFLIAGSYISKSSTVAFIWARILRIYPALIVSVVYCVFVVGLWFTTLDAWDYLSSSQTHKFILKNTTLFFGVEYQLPGVFKDVPYEGAVNGSIWTLPYEVKMYVILAIALSCIVYFGKFVASVTLKSALFVLALTSISLHILNYYQALFPENAVRLFYMFFVGAAFYAWRDKIRLSSGWFLVALSLLLVSTMDKDLYFVTYTFLLPYLIFYVAYVPAGHVRKFNGVGDYSYGIYIYAFPVQQSIVAIIPDISVAAMIVYSFFVTFILSFLSWHLIEKRCLKMKGAHVFIEGLLQKHRAS